MLVPFIKMHAQGNDFVILDGFKLKLPPIDYTELAKDMCTYRTGVGADGLVLLSPRKTAAAQMIIYNSDGTRAEMCGSALRCVSSLMFQKTNKRNLTILTDSGIKQAEISNGSQSVAVNLGVPKIVSREFSAEGFPGDLVDIGNSHFVIWVDTLDDNPHLQWGQAIENNPTFPQPVNVHFALLQSPEEITIKIWERSCGATLACGTGAASCVYSGFQRGILSNKVKVNMPGGSVQIEVVDSGCILSGEVTNTFEGTYLWKA
jgi:diaminopimelate epimerase